MQNTVKTLLAQGKGIRAISRDLGISRKAVRRLIRQIESGEPSPGYQRTKQLSPHHDLVKSYVESGLSATLIHQKLLSKHGVEVSYSTVRRFVCGLKEKEVFVPLSSEPGEEAQVDFGYLGWFDLPDGGRTKIWVFNMVLSHSRYAYYQAVTDQSVATFIRCHVHAFEFFGGVPACVLLDNLKAGVIRPDFYQPLLQQQYSEFLMHYGCTGKPCRARMPHHKGKVESGVKYVKNNFLKGLEHHDFSRLVPELRQWNTEVCNQRKHGTTHKVPAQVFRQTEKPSLISLPSSRYEILRWEQRKVNRMGHITYLGSYYSVPHTLVGKSLCAKSNGSILRIYDRQQEVALHQLAPQKGLYVTRTEHLPPHKQPKGETYYRERLHQIGPSAVALMEVFIQRNKRHWKEKVQGLLHLKANYPATVIDQACQRAMVYGASDYLTVKNICERGLIKAPPPDALPEDLGGFNHDLGLYDKLCL